MRLNQGPAFAIVALALTTARSVEAFLVSPPAASCECVGSSRAVVRGDANSRGACSTKCGCGVRWTSKASIAVGGNETLERPGARRGGGAAVRAGAEGEGDVTSFSLDDKTIEGLWAGPRKHLISVGKAGVKPSHVRSLMALVEAHTLVKVKINIPRADFDAVGLQLCGKAGGGGEGSSDEEGEEEGGPSLDISVVTHSASQKTLLFAKTEFLASLADGEEE